MDTAPDAPRVGATKTVMFADASYGITTSGPNRLISGDLIFLYAGDNSSFLYMGGLHKYYQFVYVGDSVSFVQAYNGTNWTWLVTNCMGVFSNSVNVENSSISEATNPTMPLPAALPTTPGFSSMGNLALPPAPV